MEFCRSVVLLIFCEVLCATRTSTIQCRNPHNCFCISRMNEQEFQCPNEKSPKVIIKVQHKAINIQCVDTVNWTNQDLQLIEAKHVKHIVIRNCWFPKHDLVQITNIFGINSTELLTLDIGVDFTNMTLVTDYFKGLHNLKKLILGNDNVDIAEDAFKSLDNLMELTLRNSNIHLIEDQFKQLRKLTFLELANNNLSYLPSELLQNLTELKTLHLWSNRLTNFNSSTFRNLQNLELLELSHNQLERLPIDAFYGLENLKIINLSMNKLQTIPENVFGNNELLEFVSISRNPNLTFVPRNLFSNLTKLENILLNECNLSYLPTNLFDGSIHLKNISLQKNQIELIPRRIFKDLVQLQNLDLSYNKIKDLSNEVFASLTDLKSLNLENNLLTNIKEGFFQSLQYLELLNLRNNKISFIDVRSFQRIVSLKKIVLANNFLSASMGGILSNNVNLEVIDLSNNNITAIDNFFAIKVGLRELDLSYNHITYIEFSDLMTVSFPIKINLKHNNISTVSFDYAETMAESLGHFHQYPSIGLDRNVYLDGNPIRCDCYLYNFARYFDRSIDPMVSTLVKIVVDNLTCISPIELLDFPVKKLTPNILTCSLQQLSMEVDCPEKCSCAYRPYDNTLIVNCMEANLTEAPNLTLPTKKSFNEVEVYLQRNLLTSGPTENMGYENVTKLFLSYNSINEVTWVPPKIMVLHLNNNNIQHLDENVLTMLNTSFVTNISLGNNPFNCDCSVEKLRTYVVSHLLTGKVHIDTNNIQCENGKEFLVATNDYCSPYMDILIGFSIVLFLAVLGVATLIIFWAKGKKDPLLKHKVVIARNE